MADTDWTAQWLGRDPENAARLQDALREIAAEPATLPPEFYALADALPDPGPLLAASDRTQGRLTVLLSGHSPSDPTEYAEAQRVSDLFFAEADAAEDAAEARRVAQQAEDDLALGFVADP